jgi:hypothetical protein
MMTPAMRKAKQRRTYRQVTIKVLVVGAALAGIVRKCFERLESLLTESTKLKIAVWLVGVEFGKNRQTAEYNVSDSAPNPDVVNVTSNIGVHRK